MPASVLIRIWSHMSLLLEGKPPNVMTLVVGIYPNQSQTPWDCGAAGALRSCYSGDPHCVYCCGCEHQKGHGQMCWTVPCLGSVGSLQEGTWSTLGGCAAKGPLFSEMPQHGFSAGLSSSVFISIFIMTSHRPLGITHVCRDILLVHGNGWRTCFLVRDGAGGS